MMWFLIRVNKKCLPSGKKTNISTLKSKLSVHNKKKMKIIWIWRLRRKVFKSHTKLMEIFYYNQLSKNLFGMNIIIYNYTLQNVNWLYIILSLSLSHIIMFSWMLLRGGWSIPHPPSLSNNAFMNVVKSRFNRALSLSLSVTVLRDSSILKSFQ